MESAIHDVAQTRGALAELADSLGFPTQGSFTRFFRQKIGVAPDRSRTSSMAPPGAWHQGGRAARTDNLSINQSVVWCCGRIFRGGSHSLLPSTTH
jgi:AraC-like DNA-binding protein